MKRNPSASDYIPMHTFKNTKFDNVSENAVIWIDDPPRGWANPTDCGAFPCTAPLNIVLRFEGSQFIGSTRPLRKDRNFSIVSDVPKATNAYARCETVSGWNAAHCLNTNLGVLLFESLDGDTEDRSV